MNIGKLWAMILVTSAFGAVVARDIPPGPDLEVHDIMIAEEENVMDYWNYTAKLNIHRVRSHGIENLNCNTDGQLLPHPTCCSMFVQCSWSTPVEQTCAPGTAWSQSASTCVHISTTNCGQIAPVSPYPPADCTCGMAKPNNRIVGGVEVTPKRKYPWQVGLRRRPNDQYYFCGGSIINSRYVLTAAHCFHDLDESKPNCPFNPQQDPHVKIGDHDQKKGSDDDVDNTKLISVKQVLIHPCYNCKTGQNDFALLKLNDYLVFNDVIKPVCLPDDDSKTYAGEDATIAGWGETTYLGNLSPTLLELEVKIVDNNNCGLWDKNEITSEMLCASEPITWGNTCRGDSGGPLVVEEPKGSSRYVQVGLASFVQSGTDSFGQDYGCNVTGFPGVYSRVSKVLDWIKAKSANGQYCDNQKKIKSKISI